MKYVFLVLGIAMFWILNQIAGLGLFLYLKTLSSLSDNISPVSYFTCYMIAIPVTGFFLYDIIRKA